MRPSKVYINKVDFVSIVKSKIHRHFDAWFINLFLLRHRYNVWLPTWIKLLGTTQSVVDNHLSSICTHIPHTRAITEFRRSVIQGIVESAQEKGLRQFWAACWMYPNAENNFQLRNKIILEKHLLPINRLL